MGSQILLLLANPLNVQILRRHEGEELRQAQLHRAIAWSAESTLRSAVATLCDIGALEKRPVRAMPYAVATRVTEVGEEMLSVAVALEDWLAAAPGGPVSLESEVAGGYLKALAGGWSSTLIRAVASGPQTLTELARLIPEVSYPSLERRLKVMHQTGQVEPVVARGQGTPYLPTDWLRKAVAPICVAGRCELRYLADYADVVTEVEVESAFLLSVPLARLTRKLDGRCALVVRTGSDDEEGMALAGVTVDVERGEVRECVARVDPDPSTWALGTADDWLDAMIDGEVKRLRFGGERAHLARALVSSLRQGLFLP